MAKTHTARTYARAATQLHGPMVRSGQRPDPSAPSTAFCWMLVLTREGYRLVNAGGLVWLGPCSITQSCASLLREACNGQHRSSAQYYSLTPPGRKGKTAGGARKQHRQQQQGRRQHRSPCACLWQVVQSGTKETQHAQRAQRSAGFVSSTRATCLGGRIGQIVASRSNGFTRMRE